jgi:hypothetical protein
MVVMNSKQEDIKLNTKRFQEGIGSSTKAMNVVTGASLDHIQEIDVPAVSTQVFELK